MRNSITLWAFLIVAGFGAYGWAQDTQPNSNQMAMEHSPSHPLMTLPGMRTLPDTTASPPEVLPLPLISDVINAPNPFDSRKGGLDGQTQITYRLDKSVPVTVTLYDLFGVRVRRWQFSSGQNGGREGLNNFWWDGTNEAGQKVSKGGYLAQIEIEVPGAVASVTRKIGVIH